MAFGYPRIYYVEQDSRVRRYVGSQCLSDNGTPEVNFLVVNSASFLEIGKFRLNLQRVIS